MTFTLSANTEGIMMRLWPSIAVLLAVGTAPFPNHPAQRMHARKYNWAGPGVRRRLWCNITVVSYA